MTPSTAAAIADEQIAHWRKNDVGAPEAWVALGCVWSWAVEWWEVRGFMIRWLLNTR